MLDTIDELFARWQNNPADANVTAALCDALRRSPRADLVDIVGGHASRQLDVPALVAAARMYEGTGRLDDAQQVLLAAGRLAPRDGEVYRWLGVVLLRRGDAERAEKVLERAIQFGANGDAGAWLDRARALLPTQRSSGMMAVADEIAKAAAPPPAAAPAPSPSRGFALPPVSTPPLRSPKPARAPIESYDDEVDTLIKTGTEVAEALDRARAPLPAAGAPPASWAGPPAQSLPPANPLLAQANPFLAEANPFLAEANPFLAPQTASVGLPPPSTAASAQPIDVARAHVGAQAIGPSLGTAPFGSPAPLGPPPPTALPLAPPPPAPPMNPVLAGLARREIRGADGTRVPEPRDVLDALQIAGVFEPDGAVRPDAAAWTKPDTGRRRVKSVVALVGLAALLVAGGIGTFRYVTARRAREHVEAEALLAKLDAELAASDAARLESAEKDFAHAFDLESRSPHAALSWLRERAMVGLTKGGENVAFEDGAQRAKEVGVEEKRIAFAYVASFLFQNDTAGAASKVAQWDGKADDDAWYQLLAGATFERAGDARALERYAAAVRLDPGLVGAEILLARATAVDGDPQRARELAKEFRAKHPDRPEGAALVALAWARDPMHGEAPPDVSQVRDPAFAEARLPVSLRAVPHAVRAVAAIDAHKPEEAKPALQRGLALADTPGVAAWLGGVALATGDEALARKAALAAVSYSAVYPPARVLAGRVALLGARLDEALKAAEELPPTSPDVAVVTAAVAYEKVDAERMTRALDATSDDAKKLPFMAPLVRGHLLMAGQANAVPEAKALEMADGELPWGDLVAMDAALDTGDLDLADKIAATWKGDPRALRVVRLARLARYHGRNDDADRLSRVALEAGTVTLRALAERVFALVASNKDHDAVALFKTYPNVGGAAAKWLRAYAIANGGGKTEEARAIVAQEDPPSALAPAPVRIWAAAAYGATKDARHGGEIVRSLASSGFANPDVVTAAEKVGAPKVSPAKSAFKR